MDAPRQSIRIMVAEPESLCREAVGWALAAEPDLVVVAEAADGLDAVKEVARTQPDVAVVSMDLPWRDGIGVAGLLADTQRSCSVLVLGDGEHVDPLLASMEAGAQGYLTKDCTTQELIHAVRALYRGEVPVPRRMVRSALLRSAQRERRWNEARVKTMRLTRRQRRVLALLAEGASSERISAELVISAETARTHVQHILAKLGVHSRLEAAAFVIRHDLLRELQADELADRNDALG